MNVQAYLMFNGRTEEAIGFYQHAVGAEVTMLMRFRDAPESPPPGMIPDGWDDKIMHSSFKIGEAELMASDGCQSDSAGFAGISLSLSVANAAEAEAAFTALSEGGTVTMPLGPTFFASSFGMLTDRFGVSWMIVVSTM
ncbi:VOC family protein [Ancylobacter dichloromethanicus]|uniref:VOC family protein n=1 Tax=Ancylobacter dichloromethanicus TaxID=518825 RepID=A0A9W6MYU7_9HYPH|nr:VOC family protein [Ancylobacter dichloromethanicus]MBS7554378.1 VOC family protein [Ancylobacter dichloromethanicus]GLK71503.1 VOC family protein [Ancylobacter dichloromethanicus]